MELSEYTCQNCQKRMLMKPQQVQTGISPVCSNECQFRVYMKVLKQYTNDDLKIMWEVCFENEELPDRRTEAIYQLVLEFLKGGRTSFSSVSSVSSNEHSEQRAQNREVTNSFGCFPKGNNK